MTSSKPPLPELVALINTVLGSILGVATENLKYMLFIQVGASSAVSN
jgi:hypothetical protein